VRVDKLIWAARDVLVLVLAIIASVLLAYQVSLHDQRDRAQVMADVVLNRSERTTNQLAAAFQRLAVFEPARTCSPEAVALMREVALGSSLLQGLGVCRE
jgi:sensor c-di-GMP phosphodiesterase-like protein